MLPGFFAVALIGGESIDFFNRDVPVQSDESTASTSQSHCCIFSALSVLRSVRMRLEEAAERAYRRHPSGYIGVPDRCEQL